MKYKQIKGDHKWKIQTANKRLSQMKKTANKRYKNTNGWSQMQNTND